MTSSVRFAYDVFLSYAHQDAPWADLLYNSLINKNVRVFRDKERLQPGLPWEKGLVRALNSSRHLIVLWSRKARDSEWVNREVSHFANIVDFNNDDLAPRKILFVLLEDQPQAYKSFQMITDLRDADVYTSGITQGDDQLWYQVMSRIETAIVDDDNHVVIPLAVLAMTQEHLVELDETHRPNVFSPNLKEMLAQLNVEEKAKLLHCYGTTPNDWRPFGGTQNILGILDMLKDEMNGYASEVQFRWKLIEADFWSSDPHRVKREASKLYSGLAALVIDPLSLYDSSIRDRLSLLHRVFENENAVIMVLSPIEMPGAYNHLRTLLRQITDRIDSLYEPTSQLFTTHANCHVNVGDAVDIKRILLSTLRPAMSTSRARSLHGYLRV